VLTPEHLLDLARTYADELGYTPIQECQFTSVLTCITGGELVYMTVFVGPQRFPVPIIINLSIWGDISLRTEAEIQRQVGSPFSDKWR
jgi:hypothetical protein